MAGHDPEKAACRAAKPRNPHYGWLNRRQDFLRAAKGARVHNACFVLQAVPQPGSEPAAPAPAGAGSSAGGTGPARFGLTVSKKNGNAVKRNRIKRRLRAALDCAFRQGGHTRFGAAAGFGESPSVDVVPVYDYVVVARPQALTGSFDALVTGLQQAVTRIHTGGGRRRRQGGQVQGRSRTASTG